MAAWRRCLLAVATLLLVAAAAAAPPAAHVLRGAAVVYHVNVALFRDGDVDGVGDLAGVTGHLDSLARLGVDVVWLSPIFPSEADQHAGHKTSNFKDIDPVFGDIGDFHKLVDKAASLGMKVVMELVPNHTSDSHEWFESSVQQREPYADYYVWADAVDVDGDRAPPNNWLSVAGGSAWTWHEERGQYFLHQFGETQPDLNYRNPAVRREMEEVLVFWMHHGVSGFVLSRISHLYESNDLKDEPLRSIGEDWEYSHLVHTHTLDLPETYDQVHQWHQLMTHFSSIDNITRCLVVESHSSLPQLLAYYGSEDNPVADIPLNLHFLSSLHVNNSAEEMETAVKDWLLNMPRGCTPNWMVGTNVLNDMVSYFSGHMVDALNIMLQVLPGVTIVYNTDVITETAWAVSTEYSNQAAGDEAYPAFGWELTQPFENDTTGSTDNAINISTTDASSTDEKGTIQELENVQARLLKNMVLRQSIPTLQFGEIQVSAITTNVLLLVRTLEGWDTFTAIINFGDNMIEMNMSIMLHNATSVSVHTASSNSGFNEGEEILSSEVTLPPYASVLLRLSYEPSDTTKMSTEEPAFQTELFSQQPESNETVNDNVTEISQLFESSTEMPDNITEVPTTARIEDYEEIPTADSDSNTEISMQTPYNSTERFYELPENNTGISELANESTETAGTENSTEISTAANVINPELYTARPNYSASPTNLQTTEASCNACINAHVQTQPTNTTSTRTSNVGEQHTRHSICVLFLISISTGFL